MSMWEIEALAEMAVGEVAKTDWPLEKKRNAYANIFALTSFFDTSFTHFRTVEPLHEASFFLRVDLQSHPDYEAKKETFDTLENGRGDWLQDDDGEWEALYEPESRGGQPPGIWFDVTMPFWNRAVEAGLIDGLAAQPVEMWDPRVTLVELMKLADHSGNTRLLKMLHGFVAMLLMGEAGVDDPVLSSALELPSLADALNTTDESDSWVDERFDAREALQWIDPQFQPFIEWWCGPYASDA